MMCFFFQAEDGIRDVAVTGVQTCALPISAAHLSKENGPVFLGGHPMAGRELSGIAHADADLFRGNTYALVGESSRQENPRVSAFVKILEKRSEERRVGKEGRSRWSPDH